jgi:membrane-associated phospholipid phosphatase
MQDTSVENTFFEDIPIYKMSMHTFLDGMGFYGPFMLIFIVSWALRNQPKYMWVYLIAVFANNFINKWLKSLFLEDRPKNPIPFSKYETYKNIESYGMPSGHASAVGFSIIYLLLVKSHSIWLPICIFIGILTMYQRVKYRRHTVEQVCMGAITGGVCGWVAYSLATQWILWL